MSYIRECSVVTGQEKIAKDIYRLWFHSPAIASNVGPGQFITIFCKDKSRLLPRPFGISQINREEGQVCFVYKIVGEGTKEFSELESGDKIEIMGPLGNGFTIKEKPALLIGGGTGIPILVELAKRVKDQGIVPSIVVGFREETYLLEELYKYGKLFVATEEGSVGIKGNVMDVISKNPIEADIIYACGPHPMLKAVKEYAAGQQVEAQISLEEKMACGIGACLACTCRTGERDSYTKVHNKRICKEGPVFLANEVEL